MFSILLSEEGCCRRVRVRGNQQAKAGKVGGSGPRRNRGVGRK
ncbi:hypothetical protein PITC_000640 [Penicillium italicum]|uniref:Uncharacterized protein n=1 Tax=Penicillium italicum TaxID=40296 RepID=A0A0A2KLF9_PENIT|nr:hypothetical protein PITC_000640 [Penicillium italicum]